MESNKILDLEGIEKKFQDFVSDAPYQKLAKTFSERQNILILGNGGNYAVAQHGAADCSRLTSKNVISFDNPTYITSSANDNGYEDLFLNWLKNLYDKKVFNEGNGMVIGLSSTGTSKNICGALNWSCSKNVPSFMVAGVAPENLRNNDRRPYDDLVDDCIFGVKNFHTAEILSLMMFYQLVESNGDCCPQIDDEKDRRRKLKCNYDNLTPYASK